MRVRLHRRSSHPRLDVQLVQFVVPLSCGALQLARRQRRCCRRTTRLLARAHSRLHSMTSVLVVVLHPSQPAPASTELLPTGHQACPRWCITVHVSLDRCSASVALASPQPAGHSRSWCTRAPRRARGGAKFTRHHNAPSVDLHPCSHGAAADGKPGVPAVGHLLQEAQVQRSPRLLRPVLVRPSFSGVFLPCWGSILPANQCRTGVLHKQAGCSV